VYDGHRFAQYFANTIEEHPLLFYVTALPFTPANTSIYKRFYDNRLPKVVCGVEKSWLSCSCCEATMAMLDPSHSHLMDRNLSRGLVTGLFEFGMQAPVSRCSHRCKGTTVGFVPLHFRPMDPKLSRGLMTGPFEFGMQVLASRCSHRCKCTTVGFVQLHFRPKSSRGLMTKPFEFGTQAPVSRYSHRCKATMIRFIRLHFRLMDPKSSQGLNH
jgi:hypothetical protein